MSGRPRYLLSFIFRGSVGFLSATIVTFSAIATGSLKEVLLVNVVFFLRLVVVGLGHIIVGPSLSSLSCKEPGRVLMDSSTMTVTCRFGLSVYF